AEGGAASPRRSSSSRGNREMFKGTRRGTRVLLVSALAGGLLSLAPITAAHATTNPTPVPLSLVNGWRSAQIAWQTGVPGVVLDDNGIVHLSGAILHGASNTLRSEERR